MDSGEEGTAGYICRITGLSEQSMKQGQTIRGLFSLAPGSAEKKHNHLSLFTELCFLFKKKKNWQVDKNPRWCCPLPRDKCYLCSRESRTAHDALLLVSMGAYYMETKMPGHLDLPSPLAPSHLPTKGSDRWIHKKEVLQKMRGMISQGSNPDWKNLGRRTRGQWQLGNVDHLMSFI